MWQFQLSRQSMALLKIYGNSGRFFAKQCQSGFTVLETMVVFALLAAIAGFCAFADIQSLRFWKFFADRDAAVFALRRARAQAIGGICLGQPCAAPLAHGVRFDPIANKMVIFQGSAFDDQDPNNETIAFESPATRIAASSTIDAIFNPVLANSSAAEIILEDDFGHRAIISVNFAGAIDWH